MSVQLEYHPCRHVWVCKVTDLRACKKDGIMAGNGFTAYSDGVYSRRLYEASRPSVKSRNSICNTK